MLGKYDRDEVEDSSRRIPPKFPGRVIELLRFAAAFWAGRLERFNPDIGGINNEHLMEIVRDYLHLERTYSLAYPEAENLPLLAIDLSQRIRDRVSEKKSGTYPQTV